MSTSTTIEWTEVTWNPATGCDRISPGCDNCYALKLAKRLKAMGQAKYQRDDDPRTSGPGFEVTVQFVESVWSEMERLSADDAVPLARLVRDNVRTSLANWNALGQWPLPNVWAPRLNRMSTPGVPTLRRIPAAVRFLSLEPLLGPVPSLDLAEIDWLIVGGESGPQHRPLDLDWVRDIRDQCVDRQVALFFKQIGGLDGDL